MKGIMFTEAMFHATVEGRKTMTRRIINPQPICLDGRCNGKDIGNPVGEKGLIPPRYKLGETVYLKEPYYITNYLGGIMDSEWKKSIKYKYGTKYENYTWEWSKKRTIPAKYARYFIEITGVRCERLQNISDEDCVREGLIQRTTTNIESMCFPFTFDNKNYYAIRQEAYAALIDSINGKGTWDSNPWVWVYDYKLIK